jgi:hypothetical protein
MLALMLRVSREGIVVVVVVVVVSLLSINRLPLSILVGDGLRVELNGDDNCVTTAWTFCLMYFIVYHGIHTDSNYNVSIRKSSQMSHLHLFPFALFTFFACQD